jgi:isoleucyl-tRNA synthetase
MSNSQINLPKTAFSMKANLPVREPEILEYWKKINLYQELDNLVKAKKNLFFMMALHMQMAIFIWVLH